jgi:uncharacterized LabA/DUF88 family protein
VRKYLFIDGASFEEALKDMCKFIFPNEDVLSFVDFRQVSHGFDRVFYYDSLPARKNNQTDTEHQSAVSRKQMIFDRINAAPNSHVRGAFSKYARRLKRQEQKGVDVLFAIDVLQHTYQGNMDKAAIITGDLDFLPLFDAIVQTRVTSELIYDKRSVAAELVESADISRAIRFYDLGIWLIEPLCQRFRLFGSRTVTPSGKIGVIKEIPSGDSILTFAKISGAEEYVAIHRRGTDVNCQHAGGLEILCEQTGVPLEQVLDAKAAPP